jgi:hypothetical protein
LTRIYRKGILAGTPGLSLTTRLPPNSYPTHCDARQSFSRSFRLSCRDHWRVCSELLLVRSGLLGPSHHQWGLPLYVGSPVRLDCASSLTRFCFHSTNITCLCTNTAAQTTLATCFQNCSSSDQAEAKQLETSTCANCIYISQLFFQSLSDS